MSPRGLKPPTPGLGNLVSIQLNYGDSYISDIMKSVLKNGTPTKIQTWDLRFSIQHYISITTLWLAGWTISSSFQMAGVWPLRIPLFSVCSE